MPFKTVLLVNDDGIDAAGLSALVAAFSSAYRVFVVAPDRERSGVGHAFTLFNPLRADPSTERFPRDLVASAYRCSGTPADCVKVALLEIFKADPPDLVVSGINHGANMGLDVLYSGTVAGAMEGLLNDRPAMAVSLVTRGEGTVGSTHSYFATAADWALRLVRELEDELRRGAAEGYFLNVNLANQPADAIKGWAWTDLANAHYDDRYVVHKDPAGRPHYWLEGELVLEDRRPECDIATVRRQLVSVTPLTPRISHGPSLARLLGRRGPKAPRGTSSRPRPPRPPPRPARKKAR